MTQGKYWRQVNTKVTDEQYDLLSRLAISRQQTKAELMRDVVGDFLKRETGRS